MHLFNRTDFSILNFACLFTISVVFLTRFFECFSTPFPPIVEENSFQTIEIYSAGPITYYGRVFARLCPVPIRVQQKLYEVPRIPYPIPSLWGIGEFIR